MSSVKEIRNVSLFSGIGGLEIGASRAIAGFRTVAYCEREAFSASVLLKNMEDEKLQAAPVFCGDITELTGAEILEAVGGARINCITAGFPCQDLSVANYRGHGLQGERSGLYFEALRLIRELRPDFVILENVPALVKRGLDIVTASLHEAGYDTEWGCFRADEDAGSSHKRERIFIFAWRVSDPQCDLIREQSERRQGPTSPTKHQGDTQSGDMGEAVGNTDSTRRTKARRGHEEHARCEPVEGRGHVVNTDRTRLEGRCVRGHELPDEGSAGTTVRTLGNTDSGGLRVEWLAQHTNESGTSGDQSDRHGQDGGLSGPWPPRPNDEDGWRQWLDEGGPAPCVRLRVDGLSKAMDPDLTNRADQLRALGNAVCPPQAEVAIRTLIGRACD